MATHELVHVIQEYLSPGIEDSPLWWDEGLAVYLSDQWQFESQFCFREPVLQAIRDRQEPSFCAVQTDFFVRLFLRLDDRPLHRARPGQRFDCPSRQANEERERVLCARREC